MAIIFEAEGSHGVENFCIAVGISAFGTVRIISLNDFEAEDKKR